MKHDPQQLSAERNASDSSARDAYLETGKVPASYALRKGLASLCCDPWRMIVQQMPGPLGFLLRRIHYRRKLGSYGEAALIDPWVEIADPQNVYLGRMCYLGRFTQLIAPEGYIRIGRRTHVMARILGHAGVEIGDYAAINGMIFSATDSHQGGYRMSGPMIPAQQRKLRRGKVVIGDDAFIGNGSIVMPGVTVGEGAIVGPNSLVISDVAPMTVVMGNPARKISDRDPIRFPKPDAERKD